MITRTELGELWDVTKDVMREKPELGEDLQLEIIGLIVLPLTAYFARRALRKRGASPLVTYLWVQLGMRAAAEWKQREQIKRELVRLRKDLKRHWEQPNT